MNKSIKVRMCFRVETVTPPHHTTPCFFFFLKQNDNRFHFDSYRNIVFLQNKKRQQAFPTRFSHSRGTLVQRTDFRDCLLGERHMRHLFKFVQNKGDSCLCACVWTGQTLSAQKTLPTQQPPPEHGQWKHCDTLDIVMYCVSDYQHMPWREECNLSVAILLLLNDFSYR